MLLKWAIVLTLVAEVLAQNKDGFDFGSNWLSFVKSFTVSGEDWQFREAALIARQCLLTFLSPLQPSTRFDVPDPNILKNVSFLDIGCGSGLHSLAAAMGGANPLVSVDMQEGSVYATSSLRDAFANDSVVNWSVLQHDILGPAMATKAEVVYSWGVLHHTGEMYAAIANACGHLQPIKDGGGLLFIALYSREATMSPAFWVQTKKQYLRESPRNRHQMEINYGWQLLQEATLAGGNPFLMAYESRLSRGMDFWTDVKDWLGGYPIEFSSTVDVIRYVRQTCGLEPLKVMAGTVTEYLFAPPRDAFSSVQAATPLLASWYTHLESKARFEIGPFLQLWPDDEERNRCFAALLPPEVNSSDFIEVLEDGALFGFSVELPEYSIPGMVKYLQKEAQRLRTSEELWRMDFDGYTCISNGRFIAKPVQGEGDAHSTFVVVLSPSDASNPNDGQHRYSITTRN